MSSLPFITFSTSVLSASFQVSVTVHLEQSVKSAITKKMQQSDVYYQLLSQHVSGIIMPIFRRTKTVCYCIWCTALVLWMWLVAVVGRCVVGWEHTLALCARVCSHPTTQRPTTATNHIHQNQRSTPYAVTHGLCSPEDGHNDARNMLRQKLIINI